MRRIAFVTASVGVGACSLFTDFGGLDDPAPDTILVVAEGGSSDGAPNDTDGGKTILDGASEDATAIVGGYGRTLTLSASASGPTADAGSTQCIRLGPEIVGAAIAQQKLRADLGDLRIYGANGPMDIVVDALGVGRAEVCFKLERSIAPGGSDTYDLRYGDPAAQQPNVNRGSFFASFYDGFQGTALDTQRWLVWGSPVIANNRLELRKGAEHGITTPAGTDGVAANVSLEIKAEITNPLSDPIPRDGGTFYYWLGFQRTGDFNATDPWAVFIARGKNGMGAEEKFASGACSGGACDQVPGTQTTDKRIYRIDRHAGGTVFLYDDGTTYTAAQGMGDLSIMVRSFLVDSDVYVYWVRARPLAFPEPGLVIGDEKAL